MGCIQTREHVQTPWELSSLTKREWLEWKKCFYTYVNQKYVPQYKQINKFFKYIGFLGDEIANNLYFQHDGSEIQLKTLVFKFDVYFMFGGMKKQCNQSVDEYARCLKIIAESTGSNYTNTEKIVREKILQDFKSNRIFQHIQKLPLSSRIVDYECLNVDELMFLWNECEKQCKSVCGECDKYHKPNQCFALGQRCWKCRDLNHFARCCPKIVTWHCNNCGTTHMRKKCPALDKECSRCKRKNHFSWKCISEIVQPCIFCGLIHLNNRQYCTANKSICNHCQGVGHFSRQCLYRRNIIPKR